MKQSKRQTFFRKGEQTDYKKLFEVANDGTIEFFDLDNENDDWRKSIDGVTGLNLSGHQPYHMNSQIARFNEELDDPLEF